MEEFKITSETDIVNSRKVIREFVKALGFGLTDITRIVTASSELVRNIYKYAGEGVMRYVEIKRDGRRGVEIVFSDDGPGIQDVNSAMEEGYSTANSMGLGLPGSKKLMDDMVVSSEPGEGTTVTIRKWVK